MKITAFHIKNFKGTDDTRVNVSDEVHGNVITLIGLNESGKTTILEALSHFVTDDEATVSLVSTVLKKSGLQDLIPKHKKAAFTGTISILAEVAFDADDFDVLHEYFEATHKLRLQKDKMPKVLTVEQALKY
jgi:predicted ATP-dependent endonuclease of OLD family